MFTQPFKKAFTVSIFLGAGYYAGKYTEQKISNTPEHAVRVIQNQPGLTWKLKYFSAGESSEGGRDGLWVTRFKPRYTGTAAYVVFHEKETNQNYLLLTTQERIINQQKVTVCEPPIGFFNGEYPSAIPHVVSEAAEREIEKRIKLGAQRVSHAEIYSHFMNEYKLGKLSHEKYQTDQNLMETAYREIEEEAGLKILALQQKKDITVSDKIIDELDTPAVYSVIRQIDITGNALPPLTKKDNDEVKHNEWIPFDKIDMKTKTVTTSQGTFPIKPYDKVFEDIEKILEETRANKKTGPTMK